MPGKLCITAAALLALGASWAGAPADAQVDPFARPAPQPTFIQCHMGSNHLVNLVNQGTPIPQGTIITVTYTTTTPPPTRLPPKIGKPPAPQKLYQATATYRAKHRIVHADTELTDIVAHSCLAASWLQ